MKASKYTLFGGAGLAAAGVVLGIVAAIMAPPAEAAPPSFASAPAPDTYADTEALAAEEPVVDETCAQVSECCEAMGEQFGGAALRSCEEAAAGDGLGCLSYLARNAQINMTEGHPLQGRLPPACLPGG